MSLALLSCLVLAPVASPYKLVFSDEFDYVGKPDPKKWTYERGFVRNQELQWYQPENAQVRNGMLVITGKRERVKNPNFTEGSSDWKLNREFADYTSASVTTKTMHSWKYGRFEFRARFVPKKGLWPAMWTVGVEGRWPSNGEIDIMEYFQDVLMANTAYGEGTPIWDTVKKPMKDFYGWDPDWASKFHVWRMEWDETMIRMYVDNYLMNATDLTKTFNPDGKNPFRQPHSLILNLAIGSTGGDPSQTEFPTVFEIDYVRIWQKES
jgi:beta-glucanase (GH16 family)